MKLTKKQMRKMTKEELISALTESMEIATANKKNFEMAVANAEQWRDMVMEQQIEEATPKSLEVH